MGDLNSVLANASETSHPTVTAEVEKIATDTNHPMHAGYHRGDKSVMDYLDRLYAHHYGGEKLTISEGFSSETSKGGNRDDIRTIM